MRALLTYGVRRMRSLGWGGLCTLTAAPSPRHVCLGAPEVSSSFLHVSKALASVPFIWRPNEGKIPTPTSPQKTKTKLPISWDPGHLQDMIYFLGGKETKNPPGHELWVYQFWRSSKKNLPFQWPSVFCFSSVSGEMLGKSVKCFIETTVFMRSITGNVASLDNLIA